MTKVKICGLREAETLKAAIEAGADFLGFVFYPPSPRHISAEDAAKLVADVPGHVKTVGLFVDPEDELLESALNRIKIDVVQLHGDETKQRAAEIKKKFGVKIIKAIRIGSEADIKAADYYSGIAYYIMFDAKTENPALPGGCGQSFNWALLENYDPGMTWFLAGGLTPENVGKALSVLKPDVVDVSSGVESAPGKKDADKIRAFIKAAKNYG